MPPEPDGLGRWPATGCDRLWLAGSAGRDHWRQPQPWYQYKRILTVGGCPASQKFVLDRRHVHVKLLAVEVSTYTGSAKHRPVTYLGVGRIKTDIQFSFYHCRREGRRQFASQEDGTA